uniref:Uncharacterized protein n=1 Tax=Theileria annulata TaxID=5874 RepID=A0A3B0N4W3_THEAN
MTKKNIFDSLHMHYLSVIYALLTLFYLYLSINSYNLLYLLIYKLPITINTYFMMKGLHIFNLIILIIIYNGGIYGYIKGDVAQRGIDGDTVERVFRIADQIGRYSQSVPNMFRVVKKNLESLEREVKIKALLPSSSRIEAFRMICKPFNRFLTRSPKDYFIHNPPRGTAYNVQLNNAKEVVREIYRQIQRLWLDG